MGFQSSRTGTLIGVAEIDLRTNHVAKSSATPVAITFLLGASLLGRV
jgi:hypothetical protein